MEETPQRVLVVTPHPDDAEFWAGGTIARWAKEGATVRYVLCTDGDKGTSDRAASPQDVAAQREQEQRDAAAVVGAETVVALHHLDGELEDTSEFRKELVRQIRLVRPDVVLCPEPYRKNLAWHRDHRISGQVTMDAVFPCARDHLHFKELWQDEGLEPHKTGTVLFWGTEQANTFIDIEPYLDIKVDSVMAHRSQMSGRVVEDVKEFIKDWAAKAVPDQEFTYGEAFRKVTFRTT